MQYTIVEKSDADKMSEAVEERLDEGWELHGPPMMAAYYTESGETTIYAQALTNEESAIKKRLKDILDIPPDQRPPEAREILVLLAKALGIDDKSLETGSE